MKLKSGILTVGSFRVGFARHLFTFPGFMGYHKFPNGGAHIWFVGPLVVAL